MADAYKHADSELLQLVEPAHALQAAIEAAQEAEDRGDPLAEARKSALLGDERKLWDNIARTPARTRDGLIAKLSVVSFCCEAPSERGQADDVLRSMARDWQVMTAALLG
jgi:hypothetical protein